MLIVFILFWVLVGLVVFFLAMRRGSRTAGGGRGIGAGPAAGQLGIIVTFVAGLVVPAIVLAFNAEHKASVGVGGVDLNKEEQRVRELFAHTCGVCDTLAVVKSVGRIGPTSTFGWATTSRPLQAQARC